MKNLSAPVIILLLVFSTLAQRDLGSRPTDTGGPLMFEQAVFDVQSYDITLNVDPKTRSITGTTVMTAKTVIPTNVIVLDLDTPYTISKLTDGTSSLKYERKEGRIWIWFPMTKQVGEDITTSITYSGIPRRSKTALDRRIHNMDKRLMVPIGYRLRCKMMEQTLCFRAKIIHQTSLLTLQCT